ncbi:unnamed protein product [Chrysodeixis includens]|uniref:Uncharacterized protein n=1 Tax=Chrysodeixis includens TaxID=689277 RepID=A0A9N8Q1D2_CHRIL|nr:unnamed protein product [Chrysodeixis includens]
MTGQPIPHAEVLEEILARYLGNTSYYDNTVQDIIQGHSSAGSGRKDLNYEYRDDNLDVKVLDHSALKKVIKLIESKYTRQMDFRRGEHEAYYQTPYVKVKCLNVIRQSIYYIQTRVNETWEYRQRYKDMHSYQISVLYGSSTAIMNKMESLFAQMKNLPWRTHFLWFLVLYEKMLACNIDIQNLIERIFLIHQHFMMVRGPKANFELMKSERNKKKNKTRPSP